MKLKPITKKRNKRAIVVNYFLGVIFIVIGLYTKQAVWYVIGVTYLGLGLYRKYWLMKGLRD